MKYLVVVEINRSGYVIAQHGTLNEAFEEYERVWRKADQYFYIDGALFSYIACYYIRNELYISQPAPYSITNGTVSSYILELDRFWASQDAFIKEREFQTELFIIC